MSARAGVLAAAARPAARLEVFENHDRAYYVWREAGVRGRILVHIDAHHDMWWIEDARQINIANFICPALKEGLVREVWWVVPDGTFASRAGRKAVAQHLKRILKKYPQSAGPRAARGAYTAEALGRPLTVTTLDGLPHFDEPVLLDIDTDYLVIPRVTYGSGEENAPMPWRTPEELLEGLSERGIRTDLATVVYSVEGGYTPIEWKFLGEEIAARLEGGRLWAGPGAGEAASSRAGAGADEVEGKLAGYAALRRGAEFALAGDEAAAERCYEEAAERLPASAAAWYRLAHLHLAQGRAEQARSAWRRVLELDSSYAEPAANPGIYHFQRRRYEQARRAFHSALDLDSSDPAGHLGLGLLAGRRKQWEEAARRHRAAIAARETLVDAWRGLAQALDRMGQIEEAVTAFEHSLKLALHGHKPVLSGDIGTERQFSDSHHAWAHAELARLHARAGNRQRAIAGYRIAAGAGYDLPSVHFRLSGLGLRTGQWSLAVRNLGLGFWKLPARLWWLARRPFRRIQRWILHPAS